MKILSIGKKLQYDALNIFCVEESDLTQIDLLRQYDYIIINGGDGTIRRVIGYFKSYENLPAFIINPTGSFNVIAKTHRVPKIKQVLDDLAEGKQYTTRSQAIYALNDERFLFSAGNMGDLQHILLSETMRFGWIERGVFKYLLAVILLLPAHLLLTPFMLMSSRKFFIFTPLRFIKKLGSFYGEVKEMTIDLQNHHNLIELDGDVVTIEENLLHIRPVGYIEVVTK